MIKLTKLKLPSDLSQYTLETIHKKGYVWRRLTNLPNSRQWGFSLMISHFIKKSHEYDATVFSVMSRVNNLLKFKPDYSCFWVIEKDNRLYGYFFAEIIESEYFEIQALIHHVYFSKSLYFQDELKQVDEIIGKWARKMGAKSIIFKTTRHPKAMLGRLSKRWGLDSWVLKRCV